ncbi:MAG: DUF5131 family protein [Alistipes sp.]
MLLRRDLHFSPEADAILGKIPSWIVRWGVTVVAAVFVGILVGCYFIKYPDLVQAPVVITTINPPADLYARYDGLIDSIYVRDGETVEKGRLVAVLRNAADRRDLMFFFFTKRIDRFSQCQPDDWGDGYDHVIVGCTVENQAMADYRLPIFKALPIKHKAIIVAPLLERVDLSAHLDQSIEEVSVSGESGVDARTCHYDWILDLRRQCMDVDVPFRFHQTGARLLKDGKLYRILRKFQISQAFKANINYRIGADQKPVSNIK